MLYHSCRRIIENILGRLDRLFNRLFTSEYNPIYRSGTIAVALLLFASVSGTILIFFYRIGQPYESLQFIDQTWYLTWLRSFHRYSSDVMLLAVILHLLRMFSQRKSWGPRLLAWLSGVPLLFFLLLTAWTGFIMVWDGSAQVLGVSVARIIDALGVMADPLGIAFSGLQQQPPSSFFFLMLFIHVVVPLAMIFGIWVHTSKMARATWFPQKNFSYGFLILLFVVAVFFTVPLDQKANLLQVKQAYQLNLFYNFWLPLSNQYEVSLFIVFLLSFACLALIPFILRPARVDFKYKSDLDQVKCNGCRQCVVDCPYEAIQMVPRTEGSLRLSELVAQVDQSLCVSCGLCSASCARMTVGPPGRKGSDQYTLGKQIVDNFQQQGEDLSKQVIIISCTNQSHTARVLASYAKQANNVKVYPVACMGSLHMGTIGYLAYYFKALILAACPARNCTNKDAYMLLHDRLAGTRLPGLPGRVAANQVHLVSVGEGEEHKVTNLLEQCMQDVVSNKKSSAAKNISAFVSGFLLLVVLALISAIPHQVKDEQLGILRLAWRMTGQVEQQCRPITDSERQQLPLHMQKPEVCQRNFLSYKLSVKIANQIVHEQIIKPGGFRSDGPLYVNQEIKLAPGSHYLQINFSPLNPTAKVSRLELNQIITTAADQVQLVYVSSDQASFVLKPEQ